MGRAAVNKRPGRSLFCRESVSAFQASVKRFRDQQRLVRAITRQKTDQQLSATFGHSGSIRPPASGPSEGLRRVTSFRSQWTTARSFGPSQPNRSFDLTVEANGACVVSSPTHGNWLIIRTSLSVSHRIYALITRLSDVGTVTKTVLVWISNSLEVAEWQRDG